MKNTYGTNYGDHRFYARVFELLLRLRGNFMWPVMWSWSFYADDPENSRTANDMGVIMCTSHHEPMARNHQEWARNRSKYDVWDYASNRQTILKPMEYPVSLFLNMAWNPAEFNPAEVTGHIPRMFLYNRQCCRRLSLYGS